MIDRLNRMNTQTAAFLLIVFAALFCGASVLAAMYIEERGVWISLFGLANNCTGGSLIMLRAAGKEVVTNNAPGTNVAQQNVAADAAQN